MVQKFYKAALAFALFPVFVLGMWGYVEPAAAAATESAADFYANNTVTIIVNHGPGGGGDYAARVYAAWWSEVSGGGAMRVKNVTGGGGQVGINQVYGAKPDGLTIGTAAWAADLATSHLFQEKGRRYDISKFNWLGTFAMEGSGVGISSKLPYESMADLQKTNELKFGAHTRASNWSLNAALISDIFGLKDSRVVVGFASTPDVQLSISRGELSGQVAEMSVLKGAIDKGWMKKPFATLSHKRSAFFPDTPAVTELVKLTPEQDGLLTTMENISGGKIFFAPPGTPPDRVQFLREAFDKLMKLQPFVKQAKLRFEVWSPPLSGEETERMVKNLASVPEKDVATLIKLVDQHLKAF